MKTRILILLPLLALPVAVQIAATAPGASNVILESRWSFVPGSEFPGAKGSVEIRQEGGVSVGLLSFDFSEGGVYVGARADVSIPSAGGELRVRVRSGEAQTIGIRLRDARGQWHQNQFSYDRPGEWSPIRWDLVDFRSKMRWGGPKDGVLHLPVKEIQVLVNKTRLGGTTGTLEFAMPQLLP